MYRALYCVGSCAIIQIILILSTLSAYQVNARRAPDDPEKRNYSPYAPWLAHLLPLVIFIKLFAFLIESILSLGWGLVYYCLRFGRRLLKFTLERLKGEKNCSRFFIRWGVILFIAGNILQFTATFFP